MAEIKGILLTAWFDFLKSRFGEEAFSRALETLSVEDRAILSTPFLASSWYPYSTLHTLRRLTRPLATAADRDLSVEIGRFMAEYVFTGVYRSLLVRDPIKQVEKFSWIGDFFFHEARKLETEICGDSACRVRYRYEPGAKPTRAICESLKGFWGKALELAGASSIKSSHTKCITTGASYCEFEFEWRRPTAKRGPGPAFNPTARLMSSDPR